MQKSHLLETVDDTDSRVTDGQIEARRNRWSNRSYWTKVAFFFTLFSDE